MRILITGGAGYIGGTVAGLLVRAGHDVTVYDNLCHSERDMIPKGVNFVLGDIADRVKLEKLFDELHFDGVMHFAALIEAGESMNVPEVYFRNNTASTLGLLEAMLAKGVKRLVFSSTAAVYGEPQSVPVREDAPKKPTNPYGESKLLVEQMLGWLKSAHDFRYASLRYFNVAGAEPGRGQSHEPYSHLIPIVLDVALGRRNSITIYGNDYPTVDGTCVRDYIHVLDLAGAHLLAFEALKERDCLVYNLGNGKGFSVREVVESARRITGHAIPVIDGPRRPGDPAVLIASSEKIGEELGWKPEFADLDSIVGSAWAWHKVRFGPKT